MNPQRSALACLALSSALLAGCGGAADETPGADAAAAARSAERSSTSEADGFVTTQIDAVRLAHQATFGPSESLVREIRSLGPSAWISQQVSMPASSAYTRGGTSAVHKNVDSGGFCSQPGQVGNRNCWRDNFSTEPLAWDFYRNAVTQPDQLRQRVALALHQVLVVSGVEIGGTYGHRRYQSIFLDNAFGNYRDVLRKVSMSPVMGDYLNNVNNDKKAPNENYARELMQLFSLGTCLLKADGTLKGGRCQPTYDNAVVRNYAYALTGWTYPPGGSAVWGCWPEGTNCRYYDGDMVPKQTLHDRQSRTLLGGVVVPQDSTAPQALELVLDSVMNHENIAPFMAGHLIRHLVRSNPSPAYVGRVATAFRNGRFSYVDGTVTRRYGTGVKGDLAATVAAVLLDSEARSLLVSDRRAGKLRSPVLHITGILRALGGTTDGAPFTWWWGERLMQHTFRAPSVFSYYPPDFPVPGPAGLVGPEFGIHNARTALTRLNLVTYLVDWNGSQPDASIPGATGTFLDTTAFQRDAGNTGVMVDRLSRLLLGKLVEEPARTEIIRAANYWSKDNAATDWRDRRVRAAAWLLLNSPDYMVQQ